MLVNVPIESLEERYSAAWNVWVPDAFRALGVEVCTVYPEPYCQGIRQGQFLDVVGTNIFKARQIEFILSMIDASKVGDSDVIFFHDLWFPGLESLFYARDALKLNFRIVGLLHAGTYDEHDFLAQCGMARWAAGIESSWFREADAIFVATHYHKQLLQRTGRINADQVHVTGFPMLFVPTAARKENLIVFPHRLAPEKCPEEFDRVAEELRHILPDWECVKTKLVAKTKSEYYEILGRAKVAVSFARQETWGIAQQEATLSGCIPVVPDRLSYAEMYPGAFRYSDIEEVAAMVVEFGTRYDAWASSAVMQSTQGVFRRSGADAVAQMVAVMRQKGWSV